MYMDLQLDIVENPKKYTLCCLLMMHLCLCFGQTKYCFSSHENLNHPKDCAPDPLFFAHRMVDDLSSLFLYRLFLLVPMGQA